jgi:hypothetical protein
VWKGFTDKGELGELAQPQNRDRAVQCLNHLVTDALECVPGCLEYMCLLHTEEVFRFCAIPQVMAIATLAELYGNPKVFTGVVKIRKGLAARLILESTSPAGLHLWFHQMATDILSKVSDSDPAAASTRRICGEILELTKENAGSGRRQELLAQAKCLVTVALVVAVGLAIAAGAVSAGFECLCPVHKTFVPTARAGGFLLLRVLLGLFPTGFRLRPGSAVLADAKKQK